MAEQSVLVVGGGLAGLACTMKLAEIGVKVDLMSLVPVKRSHSACAQGGINSVNELTRQQGDNEWLHLDDTVYGGDFLQHQPPVKEMAYWAPKIIDLMDRLGVPFNRTGEGFRDQRRFGGTLFKRTSFAGATTGQQLLYALDEQVRRRKAEGLVKMWEGWDFLGPILDEDGRCRGALAQNLVTMQIRSFKADAVVVGSGGCGLLYGRSTMSMACNGSAASRCVQAGVKYANGEFIQVHPTAIPGADKCRLMSESARGEGGRVWVPRKPHDSRRPADIPASERYYFLEERYPEYGNLVPRDIATREIFDVCVNDGLSVEADKQCVYLDLTHIPREELDRKLGGILNIYEKFQGVDPRDEPMKIFPAVHYSMGGLWADYARGKDGGLDPANPRNHQTNVPGLYAIGECDYHYHGANRLGANSLLSCIFTGLFVAPGIQKMLGSLGAASTDAAFDSLHQKSLADQQAKHDAMVNAAGAGDENPYQIHHELGEEMTRAALVVRRNDQIEAGLTKVNELCERAQRCSLSDTGAWTNQNVVFTNALRDMFPLAKALLKGALARDECRGAHFKPDFSMPGIEATDPGERRREAEAWCDAFEAKNAKWLKSTIASFDKQGEPTLSYEEVDTSLIPPRPRLYGLVGAEIIDEVWKERQAAKDAAAAAGQGRPELAGAS
ncbi:succinate dehydrogenase flavoprotein subunit [Botrimarina hoheduenensis]|uniref:succinate dehydrogenase n=1 Tax=Botrimarina hoheduenensis TaxID=2528000 RepID=A0A5C5WAP1_9BACT|nr:succinate dehydrogenase flavoprotein subunit [Botrimarina hoheduenensis]TWT47235.1 Fumarate reductase flavoprotein subunit [Botrimarina hoheduenensis]